MKPGMKLEIVCLANSRKMGGRCIAGLRTDGGGWVRPVAPTEHGELYKQHYVLRDGSEPQLLDVLEIPVIGPYPERHQPENWLIADKPWRRVRRSSSLDLGSLLQAHLHGPGLLFGTQDDRVPAARFEAAPADYSLALVAPRAVTWSVVWNPAGRLQARARFEWGGIPYDLVVTDPLLEKRLRGLGRGDHSSAEVGFPRRGRLYLTISLGEPFEGDCFKLVAAAIPAPPSA